MENRLSWYETSSAFYIVDNETGREACMGDGVDMFTDNDGNTLVVGTDRFYAALEEVMHDQETFDAYFGE